MHVKEEEEEDEFEFQSFLNGDCVSKLSIATGDEYQIGKEGGFFYDPNPPINDTAKRTKSNNHSSSSGSSSNISLEDSRIVNEIHSATIASNISGGAKLIYPSPRATFSEFKPIHQLLETADIIVDDNNKNNKSKDSSCSEDDEEGRGAVVDDTAAAAQSRPKISFRIVNPKLKKKKMKNDIKNMTNNMTQEQHQEQQQHQQKDKKIVGVEEEESFDFTTINDKDFIISWMTMQK